MAVRINSTYNRTHHILIFDSTYVRNMRFIQTINVDRIGKYRFRGVVLDAQNYKNNFENENDGINNCYCYLRVYGDRYSDSQRRFDNPLLYIQIHT